MECVWKNVYSKKGNVINIAYAREQKIYKNIGGGERAKGHITMSMLYPMFLHDRHQIFLFYHKQTVQ